MTDHLPLDPHQKNNILAMAAERIPFWKLLGMEIADVKEGWARLRVPYADKLTNAVGRLHGGVIFSAADSATGVALLGLLKPKEQIATLEIKINYLKPVVAEDIAAEARIVHRGKQTAVGEVDVFVASGSLIAKALSTYAIWRDET